MMVASTSEIDDVQAAVEQIRAQLDAGEGLLAHTVGILACHYEFVYSGVTRALGDALSFDIVGTVTPAQTSDGDAGTLLLTLTVLTGDDVEFRTAMTDSLLGEPSKSIEGAYAQASGGMARRPALILSYAAFLTQNSGDEYVATLTRLSEGAPVFGTLAVDDTSTFEHSFMICGGEHYRDRMSIVLFYGNVHPRFYTATISKEKVIDRPALITSSAGHVLKEVNGRPLVEYFEDLGLTKASETSYAMSSLPFMLDYGDGTPMVSKVFIGLTEEKHGICAGVMPEGSTMYVGVFDKNDVLLTTGDSAGRALQDTRDSSGMLIYSCVSRFMSLGADPFAELELVRRLFAGRLPFMMSYSGGEICPTQVDAATAINRFHNNTFVLCLF